MNGTQDPFTDDECPTSHAQPGPLFDQSFIQLASDVELGVVC